jgi:anti-sigma regulatory factor (Ser/Thr protein kinase)
MATGTLPSAVKQILDTPPGEDVVEPSLAVIDDRGGYEIAEVASALNTVQRSAADLAVEQAVLRRNINDAFVNLGRRNQNLLTRLLESITEMERNEADTDQLHKLFGLDHVATRMRRNAESLVVLAGVETRRQWSGPVPVIDLLRGALGEVEDYERAEIVELDEVMVNGTALADATHLVAELLENALTYSPPGRNVEVRGHAHAGGYRLTIVDHGVGMPAEDLAVANTRLAGGESFTVAPSRYLGHYVVGLHARRLGLTVTLRDTPRGGTTAEIEIGAMIAGTEPAPEPKAKTPTPLDGRYAHRSLATTNTPAPDQNHPPETLAEALGHGPAASADDTLDNLPPAPPEPVPAEPAPAVAKTDSGYSRRVRGANAPNTSVKAARTETTVRQKSGGADAIRTALNSMKAGIVRSQTETDDRQEER